MIKNTLYLITLILFALPAYAEQVITLKDGSQVKGELVSVKDDVYTIRTPAMGDVSVNSSQVGSISNPQAMPAPATPAPSVSNTSADTANQIQAAQTRVMADPQIMAEIQAIAQDPEITQLLSDPALLQAVTSKDMAAVQNNPKAQALIQNPKMRAIMEKIQQQQQPQPQQQQDPQAQK